MAFQGMWFKMRIKPFNCVQNAITKHVIQKCHFEARGSKCELIDPVISDCRRYSDRQVHDLVNSLSPSFCTCLTLADLPSSSFKTGKTDLPTTEHVVKFTIKSLQTDGEKNQTMSSLSGCKLPWINLQPSFLRFL
jgi:hypothetical protein